MNDKITVLENKMKEFRRQLGLSQEAVALSALIDRTRLQRIENRKVQPTAEEKEFIAEALASTVEECFPNAENSSGQKADAEDPVGQEAQVS